MGLELDFVNYEYSKKLSDCGFTEFCLAKYTDKEKLTYVSIPVMNIKDFPICAPLWYQVWDWFLEKFKLEIILHKYKSELYYLSINGNYLVDNLDFKLTFTKLEANYRALDICLKRIKNEQLDTI